MTAWQVASLPLWGFGALFSAVALALCIKTADREALSHRMGEAGIGMVFGIPFLILAAWMWH